MLPGTRGKKDEHGKSKTIQFISDVPKMENGENGRKKKEVEMRSCVPRSFPIAHSIDAIHHLAGRLWLFAAYKGPIHQLHHPYNKTSWLPL